MPKNGVSELKLAGVRERLLGAAETCLLRDGYASLSTRSVAEAAGTQLSQIHYHFGSKQGLVLALLEHQNAKLLRRQAAMFGQETALSARWLQACDFLEEDLASGYVRVLQEIIAAGFADPDLARAARQILQGWFDLLTEVAVQVEETLGGFGPLNAREVAALAGMAFLGGESIILIGMDLPVVSALRGVGHVIERLERSRHAS